MTPTATMQIQEQRVLELIERPLLSEKSGALRKTTNTYVFRVKCEASKAQIKKAIEKLYDVKVMRVNSLVMRGQVRRRGMHISKQSNFKKAYVTLPQGVVIPLQEQN